MSLTKSLPHTLKICWEFPAVTEGVRHLLQSREYTMHAHSMLALSHSSSDCFRFHTGLTQAMVSRLTPAGSVGPIQPLAPGYPLRAFHRS